LAELFYFDICLVYISAVTLKRWQASLCP